MSTAQERKQRLTDILWTIREYGGRIYSGTLAAACCRQWPVSRKTALEYIESLIDAEWCEMAAGVTVVITDLGRRYLDQSVARPMSQAEIGPIPSPPSSPEGEAQP